MKIKLNPVLRNYFIEMINNSRNFNLSDDEKTFLLSGINTNFIKIINDENFFNLKSIMKKNADSALIVVAINRSDNILHLLSIFYSIVIHKKNNNQN